MITPQSGSAGYAELARRLRDDILTGRLRPGQRLPSEADLQQRFGVARLTARRAVTVLRSEGLAVMVPGHGTFVRENSEVQDLSPEPGSTVAARMPTADERAELDIDDGVPVFQVTGPDGGARIFPADRWQLRWPE
jgi:GntR family transcriptional regulator